MTTTPPRPVPARTPEGWRCRWSRCSRSACPGRATSRSTRMAAHSPYVAAIDFQFDGDGEAAAVQEWADWFDVSVTRRRRR